MDAPWVDGNGPIPQHWSHMPSSTKPRAIILSRTKPRALDELLEPIADLIVNARDCDDEAARIIERLSYLTTRGPARDGSAELYRSFAVASMELFLTELRHGNTDIEPNWFKLAQVFNVSPQVAREMFPRTPRD